MRKSTKRLFHRLNLSLLAIFTTMSLLVLTSCTTLRTDADNLVWAPVPDPIVEGKSVIKEDLTTQTVTMPYWYWLKVEIYMITTEANIEKLK